MSHAPQTLMNELENKFVIIDDDKTEFGLGGLHANHPSDLSTKQPPPE
jgi:hypothetical protein